MKPKTYLIPPPKACVWKKIMKKYNNIPEIEYHNAVTCKVTLPIGWIVVKTKYDICCDDKKRENLVNWDIFDANGDVVGIVYMDNKVGFTWIYESKI